MFELRTLFAGHLRHTQAALGVQIGVGELAARFFQHLHQFGGKQAPLTFQFKCFFRAVAGGEGDMAAAGQIKVRSFQVFAGKVGIQRPGVPRSRCPGGARVNSSHARVADPGDAVEHGTDDVGAVGGYPFDEDGERLVGQVQSAGGTAVEQQRVSSMPSG